MHTHIVIQRNKYMKIQYTCRLVSLLHQRYPIQCLLRHFQRKNPAQKAESLILCMIWSYTYPRQLVQDYKYITTVGKVCEDIVSVMKSTSYKQKNIEMLRSSVINYLQLASVNQIKRYYMKLCASQCFKNNLPCSCTCKQKS